MANKERIVMEKLSIVFVTRESKKLAQAILECHEVPHFPHLEKITFSEEKHYNQACNYLSSYNFKTRHSYTMFNIDGEKDY